MYKFNNSELLQRDFENFSINRQGISSGVVTNLELWERSEVLFSPSFLSPTIPSSPFSGGSNFNDFPENQLTIDLAFLCKPA